MATSVADSRQRVFLAPLHRSAAQLGAVLDALQRDDPLAPVTVAGPSNYANLTLRHALGGRGFANVRFIPVPRLAELLGAPSLAAQGLRPLTPPVESAAVRTVAAQAGGPLAGLRGHPALRRALRATFRDLRQASPGAVERVAAAGPLPAEVVRLYRSFVEMTTGFYEREALAEAAAGAVASGRVPSLRDLGAVVFYLPGNLTPAERRMASALVRHEWGSAVLGLTGDAFVDQDTLELAAALGHVTRQDGGGEAGEFPSTTTSLLIAPDPQEEVRSVLRQVMKRAEDGVPLRRMAVLYRQAQPYARLLREQCGLAGIPAAGPAATSLAESAVGRTLAGLLRLASGDMDRDEVMGWLTACPVSPPDRATTQKFHPSQWDALSRAAGVVRGVAQWRQRLERYALEQERRAGDLEVQERRSEAGLERMRREAREARALADFIDALAADVDPPGEGAGWGGFSEWAVELLERYLARRQGFPSAEAEARDRVAGALRELSSIGEMGAAASFEAFREAVDELLSARMGHMGRTGEGLFIAPFSAVLGMEFDFVYLVGMVEGAVPPRAVDDPLLPDRVRRQASDGAPAMPLRGARARDERAAFLGALLSAPNRVLSFPKADPAAQRRQFPSRWLLEQASVLEGERVFATSFEGLGPRTWLTRTASRREALRNAASAAPADVHDHDLQQVLAWCESGRPLHTHPMAASDAHMGRALAMERGRSSAVLSPWDGDASSWAPSSRRLRPGGGGRQILSPSRLQTWAKCPFQYFLSSVLGIGALETPEDAEVITPLDKGSLVHEVLERFMREAIDQGPPVPGEPWTPAHRTRLRALAQEAFADVEARGLTGRALLWELEREAILDDLDEFLRQDTALRKELGGTPWRVELRFGFESGGPELEHAGDGMPLAFRGVIDRVDRTAGGGALVFDYKTGGDFIYRGLDKDPVDHGRLLQLPVYGLAVQQLLGEGVPVRAAYWFVTAKGGFVRRPREPLALESGLPRFREAVGAIAGGIAGGYFPANPGTDKSNCKFCDFDRACASRRESVWRRKRRDPRLAGYVRLAGEAPEDSGEDTA